MSDITQILSAIEGGDPQAAEQLLPLVYDALRKLAAAQMARERPGLTLDATALVHEAWLRLVPAKPQAAWDNRRHFFAAAAEAMRRILVENARRKRRQKHGGGMIRRPLDSLDVAVPPSDDDIVALDEALQKLVTVDADAARLVQLRYFAGLSIPQAAELLNMSPRSADCLWSYARAFLHSEIGGPT
jgi:RNA polymerase sigma factor (TIGR02999 family)